MHNRYESEEVSVIHSSIYDATNLGGEHLYWHASLTHELADLLIFPNVPC